MTKLPPLARATTSRGVGKLSGFVSVTNNVNVKKKIGRKLNPCGKQSWAKKMFRKHQSQSETMRQFVLPNSINLE